MLAFHKHIDSFRLLRDRHSVFEHFPTDILSSYFHSDNVHKYKLVSAAVVLTRRWSSHSFEQWNWKGKPVWRPFCVQSLKNIDLINILYAIATSFHFTFIQNESFCHCSLLKRGLVSSPRSRSTLILSTKHTHTQPYEECEEAWVCSYGPFVHDSFQFAFRFIWTHVRRLLFAHSLVLFELTQFINTIQIINSIYHRFTFCNREEERERNQGQATRQRYEMRIVFVTLPTTIVTASLLLDHPSL